MFSASVALAGAGAIAMSPITPVDTMQLPEIRSAAIELTAAPAFGANAYQALVNQFGNFLASYQIVVGSTQQCSICLAPESPGTTPITMSGWGTIGIAAGFLNSWLVFGQSLAAGEGLTEALGYAGLAIQTPITNTFTLITNPRVPTGGYQLADTLTRAAEAGQLILNNLYNAAIQAFVIGPTTIIGATIGGLQEFARVLASTGNFLTATYVGWGLIEEGITQSRTALVDTIQTGREALYETLTSGPTVTVNPIPLRGSGDAGGSFAPEDEPDLPESAAAVSAPASFKAIPEAAASVDSDSAGDNKTAASSSDSDSRAKSADSTSGSRSGVGGSKRQRAHAAD
jgi:hypothetical protein